jgi:hypothetical protein
MTNRPDYDQLIAQANQRDLICPPGYKRGSAAHGAWRAGYMSALRDLAEGKLIHTTKEAP